MFLKDPDAVLEYRVDWTAAAANETELQASGWAVTPVEVGGLSVVASEVDGLVSVVRLGNGIPGHVYLVGNQVSLADGSVDERSLTVRVENR